MLFVELLVDVAPTPIDHWQAQRSPFEFEHRGGSFDRIEEYCVGGTAQPYFECVVGVVLETEAIPAQKVGVVAASVV